MARRKNQARKRGLGARKRRTKQRKTLAQHSKARGTVDIRKGVPPGLVHVTEPRVQPLARKIGIRYYPAVIDVAEYMSKKWGAIKDGIVIAESDEPKLQEAIDERDARNTEAVQARRAATRERANRKHADQFAAMIRQRFPQMPSGMETGIAQRATEVGSGRVGRSRTADDPVWLAVHAHVCWNFTDYPGRLEDEHQRFREMSSHEKREMREMERSPKSEALSYVEDLVADILSTWEGRPPSGPARSKRVADAVGPSGGRPSPPSASEGSESP